MKKTMLFAVFAVAAIGFTACESNEEVTPYVDMRPSQEIPSIITQLQEVNDSIAQSHASTRGWEWWNKFRKRAADLVCADAKGALEGCKDGLQTGITVGSIMGVAAIDAAMVGAGVGALYHGSAASYTAYNKKTECGIIPYVGQITYAYCSLDEIGSSTDPDTNYEESILDLPADLDSIENIGIYHNGILDKLLAMNNGIATCGGADETVPVDEILNPGSQVQLSELEQAIISSDEYTYSFDQYMSNLANDITYTFPRNGIDNQIVTMYLDALRNFSGNEDYNDVVNLTNQYISIINNSKDLTENEKYNTYVALAVGVYSFKFWSDFIYEDDFEAVEE